MLVAAACVVASACTGVVVADVVEARAVVNADEVHLQALLPASFVFVDPVADDAMLDGIWLASRSCVAPVSEDSVVGSRLNPVVTSKVVVDAKVVDNVVVVVSVVDALVEVVVILAVVVVVVIVVIAVVL